MILAVVWLSFLDARDGDEFWDENGGGKLIGVILWPILFLLSAIVLLAKGAHILGTRLGKRGKK